MAFTLYNAPQSTCSQRVRFVFNAKDLPFTEIKLNLLEGDQLKPDYLKKNPNGVVPTLDHDGAIVIDSTVITEYLDEVVPQESFTPEDPVRRAHMRARVTGFSGVKLVTGSSSSRYSVMTVESMMIAPS